VKQRSLVSVSDRQFKKEQLKFAKKFRELMAQKYGEEFNPHRLLVDDEKTPNFSHLPICSIDSNNFVKKLTSYWEKLKMPPLS